MAKKLENWTVEKKDEIERILINMWASLGMDTPSNYEDIVQYCYEDVCETADPIEWHDGDVAIAFRRWIESK
jgi:isopropylmalate/homocitrate/citramalate synthase